MTNLYAQIATSSENLIKEFKIAENYFSDILNAQLVIFSLIVAAIVSLYFLFYYRVSRAQIKNEVERVIDELKKKIEDENKQKIKILTNSLASELVKHENQITFLRGQVYRTLGQFWDSEKKYSTAFIWWVRAANNFSKAGEERLTRLALESAKESVEKVKFGFELNFDLIGEYQRLFAEIDDKIYKIEKDLLDKALKDALNRKLTFQ